MYLMTCLILQDDSQPVEGQTPVVEFVSGSGEDQSARDSESAEDQAAADPPTQAPQKWKKRKSHYVPPPPVPTNPDDQPVIKPVGDR
jgi:hypothetical protein